MIEDPPVVWSAIHGQIDEEGLYFGAETGRDTVTATLQGTEKTASVEVLVIPSVDTLLMPTLTIAPTSEPAVVEETVVAEETEEEPAQGVEAPANESEQEQTDEATGGMCASAGFVPVVGALGMILAVVSHRTRRS
jgi:hypothetical protein